MAYIEGTIDNDFLESLLGDDVIDGIASNDTVSYADALGGVTVSLALLGLDQNTGGAGIDRLISIERLAGSAYADILTGNAGTNFLHGGDGFDQLFGGAGNDRLYGELGNDKLDGGTGADFMRGGEGDDTYYVDNAGDVVEEWWKEGRGGNDTVIAGVSYVLGQHVENLTLAGVDTLAGTGNELANVLTGNRNSNVLTGLAGNDTLYGGVGNDTLDGGSGADVMHGGSGNDTYYVDNIDDVIEEAAETGVDIVFSSASYTLSDNIERLTLTGSASIDGIGNSVANVLYGNASANFLYGDRGGDTLRGEGGDDVLEGGSGNNRIEGGSGFDIVSYATANKGISVYLYNQALNLVDHGRGSDQLSGIEGVIGSAYADTLGGGPGFSVLYGGGGNDTLVIGERGGTAEYHGGSGNDLLVGGAGDDILYGDEGNDRLRADTGKNRMYGGTGDDLYDLGSYADVIVEAPDEGFDTVQFGASFRLPPNVEKGILLLNGDLWGNDLDNVLVIRPLGGVTDVWGGAGADVFSYYDIAAIGRMRIRDFERGTDKIDLSNIFDDGFVFQGDAGRSGNGDQIWTTQSGNATILHAVFDAREQFTVWLYDLATPISTSDFIL